MLLNVVGVFLFLFPFWKLARSPFHNQTEVKWSANKIVCTVRSRDYWYSHFKSQARKSFVIVFGGEYKSDTSKKNT